MRSNVLRKLARQMAFIASTTAFAGCYSMNGYVVNSSGQSYYEQGNYQAAAAEFQQALINDPGNPDYMANLAKARWKSGDAIGAEQLFRQALTVSPSHQPAYHGMAELMVSHGRANEAQGLLQTWAATQPYVAESHIELAWLQRQMGQQDSAAQSLHRALQVNPGHSTALAHLGQYYQDAGRPDQAVAMYQQSLRADWNQPDVHSKMALAAQSVGANHPMSATAMARGVHPYGVPRQQTVLGPPSPGQQLAQLQLQQQIQLAQVQPGMQQAFMPPFAMASSSQSAYPVMPAGWTTAPQWAAARTVNSQATNTRFASAAGQPYGDMSYADMAVSSVQPGTAAQGGGAMVVGQIPSVSSVIQSDPLLRQGWSVVPGSVKVTEGGQSSAAGGPVSAAAVNGVPSQSPVPQPDPGFTQAVRGVPSKSISATAQLQGGAGMTAAADVPELEAF